MIEAGNIVILNGPPRVGKSSIATAIQDTFPGVWMNIGMDNHMQATPAAYHPGLGLRPCVGPVDSKVEEYVPRLFAALYESIAAHARHGLNVVADVNHHECYSREWDILSACSRRLQGLPVVFVGVYCPIEEIWKRRAATWGQVREEVDEGVRLATEKSQEAAGALVYDIECDTSQLDPGECADLVLQWLESKERSESKFFNYSQC